MPILPNVRHERFARAYVKTGNGALSYRQAGYHPTTRNSMDAAASRMLRHCKVAPRINELRKVAMKRSDVTIESLLQDFAQDREVARKQGNAGVAMKGTELIAKLVGLMVERKEAGQPGDFAGLDSREAVLARLARELGDEAAAALGALLERGAAGASKSN